MMVVYPEGVWYRRVQPTDVPEIVSKHLADGRPVGKPVDRLVWKDAARMKAMSHRAWRKVSRGHGGPRESRSAARSPE